MDWIVQELEEQHELHDDLGNTECTELVSALRSFEKVLCAIQDLKRSGHSTPTFKSVFETLVVTEYRIHLILGNVDVALLSLQDDSDDYRFREDFE